MSYAIKTRFTKRNGPAFDLYYRWQGRRYRPLLGYNLSREEVERRALDLIRRIQEGRASEQEKNVTDLSLRDFLPVYWQAMRVKQRLDLRRPKAIVENHLLPRFGNRPLVSLKAEDGLTYITARLKGGAAPWTIRREWNVFMRILNLAVDFDKLDKNRLKRVQLPDAENRERVATDEELEAIQSIAPTELWRIVLVAIHTGLREAKILEIERSWVRLRDDGLWLILRAARLTKSASSQRLVQIPTLGTAQTHLHAGRPRSRGASLTSKGDIWRCGAKCQHYEPEVAPQCRR